MKKTLILMLSVFMVNSFAEETKTYLKTSASEAVVTIKTEETDSTQAAMYLDGLDNERFIQDLLKDKNSELAKLKAKIELETCGSNSTEDNSWIDGCGEVELTEAVRTEFGRGGWMGGYAGYTFFVGFRNDGTGRYFGSTHMVTIFEGTDAQTNESGEYIGIVEKTLSLGKITELPKAEDTEQL